MNIDSVRREYNFGGLSANKIDKNPVVQFGIWLEEAVQSKIEDPTAMSVVTFGTDGFPQSRIVLLKFFDEKGFVFFTNYDSEKGKSIENNIKVGLHFFWPALDRQVRISGFAEKTNTEISDYYFQSRPLLSQLSAIVSEQSREIPSRKFLEDKFKKLKNELKNKNPQRPENWGGYRIKPVKIEFWQGRENRLHDRFVYEIQNEGWTIKRLAP
jgi:pyridoxamine 5'-phosphate oxidase